MIRRLIILLLIVGGVFAHDELTDRRVISFNMSITSNTSISTLDSKGYEWYNELDNPCCDFIKNQDMEITYFSIFYIKPQGIGAYFNYGQWGRFSSDIQIITEEEAKLLFNIRSSEMDWNVNVNIKHFETGVTYQPYNNFSTYSGLNIKLVDFSNLEGGNETYINSKTYVGISLGILVIPYQTKQYSGITLKMGYNYTFEFGGNGFDLGIGYRI